MGACANKVSRERRAININVLSKPKHFQSTQIITHSESCKHLLIAGYFRIYVQNKYNILPNDIEYLISSFHPELHTKYITYLIDGYIRRYLNAIDETRLHKYDLDCS